MFKAQPEVSDMQQRMRVGSDSIIFSQAAKSTVPGNGVSMTNCANVTPDLSARSAVSSNVSGRSLGRPKMNDPSTWMS